MNLNQEKYYKHNLILKKQMSFLFNKLKFQDHLFIKSGIGNEICILVLKRINKKNKFFE